MRDGDAASRARCKAMRLDDQAVVGKYHNAQLPPQNDHRLVFLDVEMAVRRDVRVRLDGVEQTMRQRRVTRVKIVMLAPADIGTSFGRYRVKQVSIDQNDTAR